MAGPDLQSDCCTKHYKYLAYFNQHLFVSIAQTCFLHDINFCYGKRQSEKEGTGDNSPALRPHPLPS